MDPGGLRPLLEVLYSGGYGGEQWEEPQNKRCKFSGPCYQENADAIAPLPEHIPLWEPSTLGDQSSFEANALAPLPEHIPLWEPSTLGDQSSFELLQMMPFEGNYYSEVCPMSTFDAGYMLTTSNLSAATVPSMGTLQENADAIAPLPEHIPLWEPSRNYYPEVCLVDEDNLTAGKRDMLWPMSTSDAAYMLTSSNLSATVPSMGTLQWNADASAASPQHNPLCEPSPLGLRLRKSPSFQELPQRTLSPGNSSTVCLTNGDNPEVGKKKDIKSSSGIARRMKAAHIHVTQFRIGTWERTFTYDGDLLAKCYFAKRKLVWEFLDGGGLKSKIEFNWSDISDIKATCPDYGPSTLDIVLERPPVFHREKPPQPGKRSSWDKTSDFTGGQASIHRRHVLEVAQGLLSEHFANLIQCDPRLDALSRQPAIVLDSPYFDSKYSVFDNQHKAKCLGLDPIKGDYGSPFSGLHDAVSPPAIPPSKFETRDMVRTPDLLSQENLSPISVMDFRVIEENTGRKIGDLNKSNKCDQFNVHGIHRSASVNDFTSHIPQCVSEQTASTHEGGAHTIQSLRRHLSSDSQTFEAVDETRLMLKVNSFGNLLQMDTGADQNLQMNRDDHGEEHQQEHDDDDRDDDDFAPCSTMEEEPLLDLEWQMENLMMPLPASSSGNLKEKNQRDCINAPCFVQHLGGC